MSEKSRLDYLKKGVEILAIFSAGLFAFLTWGIDQIEKREPSWALEIINSTAMRLKKIGGSDALEVCNNVHECDAVACNFPGNLEIENKGKRPIKLGVAKVELFFIEKSSLPAIVNDISDKSKNYSPSYLLERVCEPDPATSDCQSNKGIEVTLEQLDKSPLFPTNKAWRPFHFEIHRGENSKSFFEAHGTLIRIRQEISSTDPIWFWESKSHVSTALIYSNASCGFGSEFKKPSESNKKEAS